MQATGQLKATLEMRVIEADLKGDFHDIRLMKEKIAEVYDPNEYSLAQTFGQKLREKQSYGIIYKSVRDKNGECAAIFRPTVLSNIRSEKHLCYEWDGRKISSVYERLVLLSMSQAG